MVSETREWSVPTPARALLWWPAVSFVLVVIRPDAATVAIIFAGLALAVLGVAVPVVARRLGASTAPSVLPAAMELAPATPSPVADEQAA